MKTFLVAFTTLAVASASVVQLSPTLYTAAIPVSTQYHNQDSLGQYSYGYSGGPSTKTEYKSLDGVIRGAYSYVDADGELQTVEYTADSANGFQASATNLPKAPIDDKVAPKPVEDTPEVAMARAEHLAAVKEAELREAELKDAESRAAEDLSNAGENEQSQQQQNGSQEQQATMSRESTSAETESPSGLDGLNGSNERGSQESARIGSSNNGDGNGNDNGDGTGDGNEMENGNNGVTRLNGLSNGLRAINLNSVNNGLTSSFSSGLTSLNLGSINANGQLTTSGLNELNSLQLNDALRFSEISPATTTQLHSIPLTSVQVPVPGTSYLRVSTPTHGYSIISPTVLTAVPTLRGTSSQTISRTLPISLSPTFLTSGLH